MQIDHCWCWPLFTPPRTKVPGLVKLAISRPGQALSPPVATRMFSRHLWAFWPSNRHSSIALSTLP
eukprot:jgi/Bigna1/60789/fgenesh1_kg.15_\